MIAADFSLLVKFFQRGESFLERITESNAVSIILDLASGETMKLYDLVYISG